MTHNRRQQLKFLRRENPYSITSSAMARSVGGTVMPSSRGLHVNDEPELRRLHYWQVRALGALEDAGESKAAGRHTPSGRGGGTTLRPEDFMF
jgi:hypothetical protein